MSHWKRNFFDKRTTLLGTIQSNRKELPKFSKKIKNGIECYSTKMYKSNVCALTIYKTVEYLLNACTCDGCVSNSSDSLIQLDACY